MLGLADGLEDVTWSPNKLRRVRDIPKAVVHKFGPFDLARYTGIPGLSATDYGYGADFRAVHHPFELGKCVGNQTLFFPNYEVVGPTGGGFVDDVYGSSGVQDLLKML
ncbi:hypothetical protein PINS_up017518 [Pythium insidiosum]|nr:hypothetical protein PINS_up017518 [Pythium insidiosum]